MRKTWLVMRYEINKTLRSAGYVIFAYLIPVAAVIILTVIQYYRQNSDQVGDASSGTSPEFDVAVEGFVDLSGLIRLVPEIPGNPLLRFEDEDQAKQALKSGEISAYYLILPDAEQQGKIYYVYPDTRSYLDDGQRWVMERLWMYNLLGGDADLAYRVWNPVGEVFLTDVSPSQAGASEGGECARPGAACWSNDLIRYMPSIMVGLFFVSFMTSSSMLFNSVSTERENRVIEVLLLSVSPRQLMVGKCLGLGTAGLLQTITWLSAMYFSFNQRGSILRLPQNFEFPVEIILLSLIFFLGGYAMYGSLMAGAGALTPKMKEAGAANYIAAFPLFFGYAFGITAPFSDAANSGFITFLSIFPLTSPVVMVMRLTNGIVPLWQMALSIALLFGSAYLIVNATSAMFHAGNLLSGQSFSLRRYFTALLGKG